MSQLVTYVWPAGDNDPGHAISLAQVGNGIILPRKDDASAYFLTRVDNTYQLSPNAITHVSGMVGGWIDSCPDGTVSGAWLLGAYGDITHMVSGGTSVAYPITGAVSGDTFVSNAYVSGRGLAYFAADNGDMVTVVSGAVAQCTGWGEAVANISADSTKLYALLPASDRMGVYTFSSNTAGTISKTATGLADASVLAASAAPGSVAIGGWTDSTLAIGATCLQANPTASFIALATPANNHITLLAGSEPNWSIASFVTGTGAPQFLVWTPNGQQLLVTDPTNGRVLVLNLVFGQLQFAQNFVLPGAGRIVITPDGLTAIVTSSSTGNLTFLTNTVGVWSISQTLSVNATGGVSCENNTRVIAGATGAVQQVDFQSGIWTATTQVSGLGFSPVDVHTDPTTGVSFAVGGTGTGHLAALSVSGAVSIASTTWSGNARDIFHERGQICVADDASNLVRVFSLSRLLGTFTQRATAPAPAGCTFISNSEASVWFCGTSTVYQNVFTSPFNIIPQRVGAVAFWNGSSFTTQTLQIGHRPSSMVWDSFGSLWVTSLQNELYRFSATGVQLSRTDLVPNSQTPSGAFPPLGISSMLWWSDQLWAVSSMTEATLQLFTQVSPTGVVATINGVATVSVTTRVLNPNAQARINGVATVTANATVRPGTTSVATINGVATVSASARSFIRATPAVIAGTATVSAATGPYVYQTNAMIGGTAAVVVNATGKSGPNASARISGTATATATQTKVTFRAVATVAGGATISAFAAKVSVPVTFNPSDLFNVTLTNSNLTGTSIGGTGTQVGVRTTGPKSQGAGKLYATFLCTSATSNEQLGIANLSWNMANTNGPGYDVNSICVDTQGAIFWQGTMVINGGSWLFPLNGIVGLAIDYSILKFWVNFNGNWYINDILGATPGVGSFVGADNNTYSIDASGNMLLNGSLVPGGGSTAQLVLYQAVVYRQVSGTLAWTTYTGSAFVSASAPPPPVHVENNPVTGAGGYSFSTMTGPYYLLWGATSTGSVMSKTLNAGQAALAYMPTGYSSYQDAGPPSVPTVTSTNVTASSLTLNWTASTGQPPITYAIGYRITGQPSFTPLVSGLTTTSYVVSNLNPNVAYQFQVTATGSGGSVVSATHTVTTVNESTNGTTLTTSSGTITDSVNNSWALTSGGVVNVNGGAAGFTSNATQVVYWNHTVYYQSSTAGWFYWTGLTWAATTNPVGESAQGTVINNTSQIIADGTGAWWTLYNSVTNGLRMQRNGTPDTATAGVQFGLYWNHQVYYQSINGTWFQFSGTPGTWTQIAGDPRTTATFSDAFTNSQPWMPHQTWVSGDQFSYVAPNTPNGMPDGFNTWWTNPLATPSGSDLYTQTASGLRLGLMTTPSGTAGVTQNRMGTSINNQQLPGGNQQLYGYYEFSVAVQKTPGFLFGWMITDLMRGVVGSTWTAEIDMFVWTDASNVQHVMFRDGFAASQSGGSGASIIYQTTTLDATQTHVYGIDWQSDFIRCYIDGVQVGSAYPNPGGDYRTRPMTSYFFTSDASYIGSSTSSPAALPAYATVGYYNIYNTKPGSAVAPQISSLSLSNTIVSSSAAAGSLVGTVTVNMSSGTFSGTLAIGSGTSVSGGQAVFAVTGVNVTTTMALTPGPYNLVLVATQNGAANSPFTAPTIVVTVQNQTAVPGVVGNLASVSSTTTSADIRWTEPTTGGALDRGKYQVQFTSTGTWTDNGPVLTYCTPNSGTITDSYGNVWSLNAAGNPVVGSLVDTPSVCAILIRDESGVIWQEDEFGTFWRYLGTGLITITFADWTGPFVAGPFDAVTVPGLVQGTVYQARVYVTNSAGIGNPSASITIATSNTTIASITGITMSKTTILPDLPANTVVGTASVGMSSGVFSGTLTIAGGTSTYTVPTGGGGGTTPPPDTGGGGGTPGGGGTTTPTTFSDTFVFADTNKWYANSYTEGGDALWVNDPALISSVYSYSTAGLYLKLLTTPPGFGISQPYISGIQDTYNPPNHFAQQYGYFEITCSVEQLVGLEFECVALSPFNWPPAISLVRIWTDASNVMHVIQFYYGGTDIWETTQTAGFDPSVPHRYGLLWTPSVLEFYRDRVLINSSPNPGGAYTNGDPVYVKMYCNANFAAGVAITSPGSLPKGARIARFDVFATKPF